MSLNEVRRCRSRLVPVFLLHPCLGCSTRSWIAWWVVFMVSGEVTILRVNADRNSLGPFRLLGHCPAAEDRL